ncbi:MAG: hypothetical protein HQ539_00890 [Parcubacteria group bacterium]|nr:hypothetical protein [Parcubacteria group bacterium]
MNRKRILNLGFFILLLTICLLTFSCERDIGPFPEMLAEDIEQSISRGRSWFYIFERDGSCECTVAYALGETEVKSSIDKAMEKSMDLRIIIPLSIPNEYDTKILLDIKTNNPLLATRIRMLPKETLNEISENNYYFSGSFICQEIERDSEENKKYVKKWPYNPKLARTLKDNFEELWQKSIPL